MPDWLKTFVLIVGLGGWLATVVVSLLQGKLPDPVTLGIPATLVLAVAPPVSIGRRRAQPSQRQVQPAADGDGVDE